MLRGEGMQAERRKMSMQGRSENKVVLAGFVVEIDF
jgi:hypothetical protein